MLRDVVNCETYLHLNCLARVSILRNTALCSCVSESVYNFVLRMAAFWFSQTD
jgi:hypothetical protein